MLYTPSLLVLPATGPWVPPAAPAPRPARHRVVKLFMDFRVNLKSRVPGGAALAACWPYTSRALCGLARARAGPLLLHTASAYRAEPGGALRGGDTDMVLV